MARESNSSAQWAQLRSLIEEALGVSAEERLAFVRGRIEDPALRAEAEQLLSFESDASAMFSVTGWRGKATSADIAPEDVAAGAAVGSYRIVNALGHGGMGAVYLAERADGVYEQRVALKILRENIFSPEMETRFRIERQLLARLVHPGIARLLDGGVTSSGRPYLVLEYVEGRPIDRYCEEEQLDVPARLRLFQKVADAVQAAHQQLVLHLDLKPANILVTAEGEPKLLDFGIARLLNEADAVTQPSVMLMTPRYASPEQAAGQALGVGSDVFSLTTLLYKLLTGRLPYPIEEATPLESARMIREMEPELPSKAAPVPVAPVLRGDLDMILMQGLRKEPRRRYPTVAALREDIQRYLDSRPVLAHRDSFGYRAGKFLRRNRISVAAAALVVLVIAASLVMVLRASATARRERASAERRLQGTQDLARYYVDELFPALADLPGTVNVRKQMVDKAVTSLETLAKESGDDQRFTHDLATGFMNMANVQGFPNNPSFGDYDGALKTYAMALQLMEQDKGDKEPAAHRAFVQAQMSNVMNAKGDVEGAIAQEDRALKTAEPILQGPKTKRWMMVSTFCFFRAVYNAVPVQFHMEDPEEALKWINRAEQINVDLGRGQPEFLKNETYISQLAYVRLVKADLLHWMGRDAEARVLFEQQLAVMDTMKESKSMEVQQHIRDVHGEFADFLRDQGELKRAMELAQVFRPDRRIEVKMGGDGTWEDIDLAANAATWAVYDFRAGNLAEANRFMEFALATDRKLMKHAPQFQVPKANFVHFSIMLAHEKAVPDARARTMLQDAIEVAGAYARTHPHVLGAQAWMGEAHLELARRASGDERRKEAQQAVALLEPISVKRPAAADVQRMLWESRAMLTR